MGRDIGNWERFFRRVRVLNGWAVIGASALCLGLAVVFFHVGHHMLASGQFLDGVFGFGGMAAGGILLLAIASTLFLILLSYVIGWATFEDRIQLMSPDEVTISPLLLPSNQNQVVNKPDGMHIPNLIYTEEPVLNHDETSSQ